MSASEEPQQKAQEEAKATAKTKEGKQKSNCLSRMLNKVCGTSSNGSEIREISATLKDILAEMKEAKEPKTYDPNYVAKTVEKIGKTVDEIDKRTKRQGKINRGIYVYGVGLALGIAGFMSLMRNATNETNTITGIALVVIGTIFAFWSLVIASEMQMES